MSAFTDANRRAFNDLSSEYDTKPWQQKLFQQVATALQQRRDWIGAKWVKLDEPTYGREVKLLDYACGTGSVTKALGQFVTIIRGIDVSEDMVEKFNGTAQASGLTPEQAHAVVGDLCAESVPDHLKTPEWYDFDIAVIGLGFHHFENPQLAIKRIVERLKPDFGVLLIIDFLPFEHEPHGERTHTIKKAGFNRADIAEYFSNAPLEDFKWELLDDQVAMELKEGTRYRTIFFARAKREPTTWGKFAKWLGGTQNTVSSQMQIYDPDPPKAFNVTGGRLDDKVPVRLNYTGGRDYNAGWKETAQKEE